MTSTVICNTLVHANLVILGDRGCEDADLQGFHAQREMAWGDGCAALA